MQIHLFISDTALNRNRLNAELKDILDTNTVIEHQNADGFDYVMPCAYNEPIASVVMPVDNIELSRLTQIKFFWERSKNILILPDEETETLKLANRIRPVFITNMDDNFSNVSLILLHIKERYEMDIQNL